MSENRSKNTPKNKKRFSPWPGNKMAHPIPVWLLAVTALCAISFLYFVEPYFNASSTSGDISSLLADNTSGGTDQDSAALENPVRINEVMTSNRTACFTSSGASADYIELINTGSSSVSLKGMSIQLEEAEKSYTFPDKTLGPGETVLLYCSSSLTDSTGDEWHASFSLPAAGCTLHLKSRDESVIQTLPVPALEANRAYERTDSGEYRVTSSYTPGAVNTESEHTRLANQLVSSSFEITEIMAGAATYGTDLGACDYIEIHNTSSEAASLGGWGLSDNPDNPLKWTFPEGTTVPAGGYILVWCAGAGVESSYLTCDFMLSSAGENAILSDPSGRCACRVTFPALERDQAYSLVGGVWTANLAPTPGLANTTDSVAALDAEFLSSNTTGIRITEVMASTDSTKYDWVEIWNSTSSQIDLSGWGLSDKTSAPLKWTFPAGTVIDPGEYLGVFMTGTTASSADGYICADYKLSIEGGYTLCLATSDGTVVDRMFVPEQYHNISYGRMSGKSGFWFFTSATPRMANSATGFSGRADTPVYSVKGGLYDEGEVLTLTMSAPSGCRIYYTTDFSEPTETNGALYNGPLQIASTTILRTRVYSSSAMESYVDTQSYLFGADHTVNVISLVADYDDLFDSEKGIYAHYSLSNEIDGAIQYFDCDTGETLLSQGVGIKLHGDYSRSEKQKAFKIYARSELGGGSSFKYPLFSYRDYTEYSSFLLRSSGQDTLKTRMRDSVLTSLARGTSVMYQESEVCVVYIDGKYWGQYYLREHITTHSICQFEGWEGQEDKIDLIKANSTVFQGSNDTMATLLEWVNSHNMDTDTAWEMLDSNIDVQNYIEYMAIEIYTGNTDTLNVKRYRNANTDGKWRWVLYDLDWAFTVDTNSIARWIAKGGMGNEKRTNNDLFIGCMKNSTFRDKFLTYFGEQLATTFSTENVHSLFEARYQLLLPELPMQFEKWGETESTYNTELKFIKNYASTRVTKLLEWTQAALKLSDSQMEKYFGAAMEKAGYEL